MRHKSSAGDVVVKGEHMSVAKGEVRAEERMQGAGGDNSGTSCPSQLNRARREQRLSTVVKGELSGGSSKLRWHRSKLEMSEHRRFHYVRLIISRTNAR